MSALPLSSSSSSAAQGWPSRDGACAAVSPGRTTGVEVAIDGEGSSASGQAAEIAR